MGLSRDEADYAVIESLVLVDDFAGDDGGDRAALEGMAVEGGVAGLAGGFGDRVDPRAVERKNGEVGWLTGGEPAIFGEDTSWASGEEFDHAHQGDAAGVDELFQR